MITRDDVLSGAVDECMKELYSLAQPSVKWNDFIEENKIYSSKYKAWERFNYLYHKENKSEEELKEYSTYCSIHKWEGKSRTECIGPRPFEFYYLPKDILKDICDNYVRVYRMNSQQELLDTIEILKNYCIKPVVDKYIEGKNGEPGHRGYDHPDNLIEEVRKILIKYDDHMDSEISKEVVNKFFNFLDMAGNFFCWNRDLNAFNISVYLGASPNSNKEAVIKNWKEYRDKDIEIDEEQMKKDYYGDY